MHLSTRPTSKWLFVLGLEIAKVRILATLWGYNFVLRPLIGMRSETNLDLSSRAFQWHVACHLHT